MMKFLKKYIQNNIIRSILSFLVKLYNFLLGNILFTLLKRYAKIHTRLIKLSKWTLSKRSPSHYDHEINLYNWIYKPSITQFVEPGFFARNLIKKGDKVLDLCSGDGFYTYLFLSELASSVDAIDISSENIKNSLKKYNRENINYINADLIKYNLKKNNYDVIVWSEGIAYFNDSDRKIIYKNIINSLKAKGLLYIRTPLEISQTYSANQVNVITDQELFEESFNDFFDIKYKKLSEYRNRAYLNYYLTVKEK